MMSRHLRVVQIREQCRVAQHQIMDVLVRVRRSKPGPPRPLNSTASSPGMMIRPRAMIGMSVTSLIRPSPATNSMNSL